MFKILLTDGRAGTCLNANLGPANIDKWLLQNKFDNDSRNLYIGSYHSYIFYCWEKIEWCTYVCLPFFLSILLFFPIWSEMLFELPCYTIIISSFWTMLWVLFNARPNANFIPWNLVSKNVKCCVSFEIYIFWTSVNMMLICQPFVNIINRWQINCKLVWKAVRVFLSSWFSSTGNKIPYV